MNINQETIDRIKEKLVDKEQTISVAESVTSGFVQTALGSAIEASRFFEGGITTYNIDQKVKHLRIERETGEACNCVSEQTAGEMAVGVTALFGSTWGLAITGYATPVEQSGFEVYAFYAIAEGDKVVKTGRVKTEGLKGEEAQLHYANKLLGGFLQVL